MRKPITTLLFTIIFICMSGCAYLHPYASDVQQGNIITQKKVSQVKTGMTEAQVRAIMGTPLLVNTFSENRWNYVYTIHKFGKQTHQKRVIVYFQNRRVSHVSGIH